VLCVAKGEAFTDIEGADFETRFNPFLRSREALLKTLFSNLNIIADARACELNQQSVYVPRGTLRKFPVVYWPWMQERRPFCPVHLRFNLKDKICQ
jgi:hypothetical protein